MAPTAALIVLCCTILGTAIAADGIEDTAFWLDVGQKTLNDALKVKLNYKIAKNVILFLGDGMGISTITAARIYKGQQQGEKGESTRLAFEKFPHVALSKTYTVDRQTTDSAASGTAYHSGVKANFGTIGFDARVLRRNCSLVNDNSVRVSTMLDWSLEAGKSVGIVTTTRVTHASPAGTYAHSPDRNWERDRDMKNVSNKCVLDIATQLVKNNSDINVIMGGGRRNFIDRDDGKNLTMEWLQQKQQEGRGARSKLVMDAAQLRSIDTANTDYLLGLFTDSHMTWDLARDNNKEPSISEMATTAVEILKKNEKGFYLFVEGGRIDHGHHDNWAKRALTETVAFDQAVEDVLKVVGDDTLIVVTADHSHPFNIVGYPKRGNNILGLVDPVDPGQEATDGKPYATLVYADGPGPGRDVDLSNVNTMADDFQFQRVVPFNAEWETHGGEDVGIFATGPMAHLFHGVHEENYVAHAMGYAACVGPNKGHCDPSVDHGSRECDTSGSVGLRAHMLRWLMVVMLAIVLSVVSSC